MRFRYILLICGGIIMLLAVTAGLLFMRNHKNTSDEPFQHETSREFTLADVQKHGTASDCWVSYGAQVYDITRFMAGLEQTKVSLLSPLCGTNIDMLPASIKSVDTISDYSIGLLVP